MRIENNIYYRPINNNCGYKQSKTNSTPSFEGLGIKSLNLNTASKMIKAKRRQDEMYLLSEKLGVTNTILSSVLDKDASTGKFSFLRKLVDLYNAQNFYRDTKAKEDPANVLYILKDIKKPQEGHFNIVERSEMNFETMHKIFQKAKTKESLDFVQTMQRNVLDYGEDSGKVIIKMLDSKYKEDFIKTPLEYASYIKLNSEKPDCVKSLEKLLDEGKFDRALYDRELSFENLMKRRNIAELVGHNKEYIKANLTDANNKFLKIFGEDFYVYRKDFSEQDTQDLLSMFKSTNGENLKSRIRILEKFKFDHSQAENTTDTREMRKLFESMDKNPHIRLFVEKALDDNIKIESIENLNEVIAAVPPKKAEIFHKNIARIVRFTTPESRKAVLQSDIENPFYPAKRMNEKHRREIYPAGLTRESKISKWSRYIENQVNIMKYNRMMKGEQEIIEPVIIEKDNIFKTIPQDFIAIPEISETVAVNAATEFGKLNLVRTLKASPEARRLQVKSDVNDVIKRKLGQKTYERQNEQYSAKATAMRLKLLPEIFDSISASRKVQRSNGIRPNVENKDAVALYEKIQGKNRKLIRYMLKQTNENNERLFTVKDIIAFINKSEAKIAQDKKANPQYRAADAKAYYEEQFQNLVSEHGKLKRTKKAA